MLVAQWISEALGEGLAGFDRLCALVQERATAAGLATSRHEVRVVLERMIRDGRVEGCQFLAEDWRYEPTVYDGSNIYFYRFRLAPRPEPAA